MILFNHLLKYNSSLLVHIRHSIPFVRPRILFYSTTQSNLIDETEKLKPISKNFLLKKRAFTEEEQEKTFGKLVYVSPMYKNVYYCKILSLSTSMTTTALTPYILWRLENEAAATGASNYVASIIWTVFSSLFLFTPLLLNQLTKRFVLEMYYNVDRELYTAIYFNVFVQKRALTFRLNDVKPAKSATSFLYTHMVGDNLLLLIRVGYKDGKTCSIFESMLDRMDDDEGRSDDEDDDEPAKATTDHHKRLQDQ